MPKLTCPQCGKPIVSIKSNRCSYCSASIPQSMRLTPEERRREEEEAAAEDKAHREKIARDWPVNPTRYMPKP